jgi:predicted negative regulator of RcsB-dependent stress response
LLGTPSADRGAISVRNFGIELGLGFADHESNSISPDTSQSCELAEAIKLSLDAKSADLRQAASSFRDRFRSIYAAVFALDLISVSWMIRSVELSFGIAK